MLQTFQTNNASDNLLTQKSHLPHRPQTRQLHVCVEERRLCGQAHRLRLLLLQVRMAGRTSACACGRRRDGPLMAPEILRQGYSCVSDAWSARVILCINSDLLTFHWQGQRRSFKVNLKATTTFMVKY